MKLIEVFQQVLRDLVRSDMALEDVLLHAVVLHTHSIVPRREVVLEDVKRNGDGRIVLSPLTRSHLAALLATLWSPQEQRGNADFWSAQYARLTPYEAFEDVPEEQHYRALVAKRAIESHPIVEQLIAE
jgi:hypothetical protein